MQTTSSSTLPEEWDKVLDRMRQELDEAATKAEARDNALETDPAMAVIAASPEPDSLQRLDQWDVVLRGRESIVEKAGQTVAGTADFLMEGENALRDWLVAVAEARQKLAEWDARGMIGE